MNNIPDHVLRIFGGAIPAEPVQKINPMLIVAGLGVILVVVLIVSAKPKEDS